jgi:hypothetical protein
MVFRMDEADNVIGYVGGESGGQYKDFHFEGTFEPGNYLISAEFDWINSVKRDFVVSAYGDKFINLVEMKRVDKDHSMLIKQIGKWYSREKANEQKGEIIAEGVKRYVFKTGGRVFFHYENKSQELLVNETIKFTKIENLRLFKYDKKGKIVFSKE